MNSGITVQKAPLSVISCQRLVNISTVIPHFLVPLATSCFISYPVGPPGSFRRCKYSVGLVSMARGLCKIQGSLKTRVFG